MEYKIIKSEKDGIKTLLVENEDGSGMSIPIDPANSDYQAYLNKDKPVEHFTPIVTDAD